MSSPDDDGLYRGDPPAGSGAPAWPPAGYPPPGYAAPGYAAPGYAPPGYPAPGYGPFGPGPGWPRPTNTMALLAVVSIFVFAPASLVFGLVARGQIRRTGEGGEGMALAGIIVGGVAVTVAVVVLVFWFAALASLSNGLTP